MSGFRFDAWTRRRLGVVLGGLAASLAGLAPVSAKKKRRHKKKKKRCLGFLQFCTDGGRQCCGGLQCGHDASDALACCKPLGAPCLDPTECCQDGGTTCAEGACALE